MRAFIFAILQTISLLLGIGLTMLLLHFAPQFKNQCIENTDKYITIGSALELTENGKQLAARDIADYIPGGSYNHPTRFELKLTKLLNTKISYGKAKILANYGLVLVFATIIAYLLGAGFIYSYLRGNSVYDPLAQAIIDKHHVYVINGVFEGGFVGETTSRVLGLIFWLIKMEFVLLSGAFLPLAIIGNLMISFICLIIKYFMMKIEDLKEAIQRKRNFRKKKSVWARSTYGTMYRIMDEGFPERKIYFKNLINAYTMMGVIKADENGQIVDKENMRDYIRFAPSFNERVRRKLSKIRQSFFIRFNAEKKEVCRKAEDTARNMNYTIVYNKELMTHEIAGNASDVSFAVKDPLNNLSLAMYILKLDSMGEEFSEKHWSKFAKMSYEEREQNYKPYEKSVCTAA